MRWIRVNAFLGLLLASKIVLPQDPFWEQTNGPYGGNVTVIETNLDGEIFAGLWQGGVYYLENDNETWVYTGLGQLNVVDLIQDTAGIVYAATNDGLYFMSEIGSSWTKLPFQFRPSSLAVGSENELFVGTQYNGIVRLRDDRSSWDGINDGLPLDYDYFYYSINVVFHSQQGDLFASLANGKLYKFSKDENKFNLLSGMQNIADISEDKEGNLYAASGGGVYASFDRGENWNLTSYTNSSKLVATNYLNHVIVVGTDGIYVSLDQGSNWVKIEDTSTYPSIISLAVNSEGNIYVGISSVDGGLIKIDYQDRMRSQIGLPFTRIYRLFSAQNGVLYAAGDGKVHRSSDMGFSWETVLEGSFWLGTWQIAENEDGHIFVSGENLFRSEDEGRTWQIVDTGLFEDYYRGVLINSFDHIIVGACWEEGGFTKCGIIRSEDDGTTWQKTISGQYTVLWNFLLDPSGNIYASIGANDDLYIYRSTDNGNSWDLISEIETVFVSMAITSHGLLFGAARWEPAGIYRSSDGGVSWNLVGLDSIDVRSIVINSNNIIYAATYGDGIFHSVDNGSTWVELNTGIEHQQYVMSLSSDNSGHLYAGTWYGGVFKSNQTTTSIQESRMYKSYTFDLLHNYPNPFNPITTIEYSLFHTGDVSLIIYNLLGEEVARLVSEVQQKGNNKVIWDASNVSSGIYFYRLQAGNFVQTRKMILLK